MSEVSSARSVGRFAGWLLVIVAVLWIGFSGLCAAATIFTMVSEEGFNDYVLVWAVGTLAVSGISAAMAYGLFVVGRGLSRGK